MPAQFNRMRDRHGCRKKRGLPKEASLLLVSGGVAVVGGGKAGPGVEPRLMSTNCSPTAKPILLRF
jgi:hypothetical protein